MRTQIGVRQPPRDQLCLVTPEFGSGTFSARLEEGLFDTWMWKVGDCYRSVSHGDFWEAIEKEPEPEWPTNKYDRPLFGVKNGKTVDVYAVIEMFGVTCPARQHAIKKLLCAGIRGKGNAIQDLTETKEAITHAIRLQKEREQNAE
jgi:hypothetical protein